jgi:hypothetical protein
MTEPSDDQIESVTPAAVARVALDAYEAVERTAAKSTKLQLLRTAKHGFKLALAWSDHPGPSLDSALKAKVQELYARIDDDMARAKVQTTRRKRTTKKRK